MPTFFDTYCGLSCRDCTYKDAFHCGGCIATAGRPFHGACEVAECAKRKKKRFCGECADFPCEILTRYAHDPEHGDHGARLERCQEIKTALVREARAGVNPVSYCGHHCDFCFLGQWCGGCRSDYNCCSFATLFEDGVCPNVACVKAKNLAGCFACDDLRACQIGYYGQPNEYIAKATALFVQKHGEAAYTEALQAALAAGQQYPKSFDETGSVESALALLERYR